MKKKKRRSKGGHLDAGRAGSAGDGRADGHAHHHVRRRRDRSSTVRQQTCPNRRRRQFPKRTKKEIVPIWILKDVHETNGRLEKNRLDWLRTGGSIERRRSPRRDVATSERREGRRNAEVGQLVITPVAEQLLLLR